MKNCIISEHVVDYSNLSETEISAPEQSTSDVPPKFIDTINPLLSFSDDDLEAMNVDVNEFFESDSSDASVDMGKKEPFNTIDNSEYLS